MRSQKEFKKLKIKNITETETSLSYEQQPSNLTYPEPDNSCHKLSRYFKNHFNIIIPKKHMYYCYCIFYMFCFVFCVSCDLYCFSLCILVFFYCVHVYGPLPQGGEPTAVNKYRIVSYRIPNRLFPSYFPTKLLRGNPTVVNKYRIVSLFQMASFLHILLQAPCVETQLQ